MQNGAGWATTLLVSSLLVASSCVELQLAEVDGGLDVDAGIDAAGGSIGGTDAGDAASAAESGGSHSGGSPSDAAGESRAGCPTPPPPGGAKPCNLCQDEDHVGCACAAELDACFDDPECLAVRSCVIVGEPDAGVKACPIVFSAAAASCVRSCMGLHPSAAAKFLALESCMYCDYCAKSCDTGLYCGELLDADGGGAGELGDASASGTP